MAKFLTTVEISSEIQRIIVNAKKTLTLVTPYLSLSRNLMERISDADEDGVKITIIYGKNELTDKENKKLKKFNKLNVYYYKELHAKCYHNDDTMIITSMNLYEYSEKNNREMGILIDKNEDSDIFKESVREINSIKRNSKISQKTEENKEEDIKLKEIEYNIYDEYSDLRNFHLPTLKLLLEKEFPDVLFKLDKDLTADDFPIKGVDLLIDNSVDFSFREESTYNEIKKNYTPKMKFGLPKIRIYWNKQLNIYLEKGLLPEKTEIGLKVYYR